MQAIPQKSSNLLSAAEINQAYRTAFSQYFDDGKRKGLTSVNRLLRKQQYPTDPGLQYILAYLYINGHLPSKHQNEAIQAWLYRAAKNGSNDAVYMIAYGHETADWGFPKDEQKMFAYYRLAAENGHMYAQYRYGFLLLKNEEELRPIYRNQKLLDEQHVYALDMLAKSAQQGYDLAVEMLRSQETDVSDGSAATTDAEEPSVTELSISEIFNILKPYIDLLVAANNQAIEMRLSAQTVTKEEFAAGIRQVLDQHEKSEKNITKSVEESQKIIVAAISNVQEKICRQVAAVTKKFSDELRDAKEKRDILQNKMETMEKEIRSDIHEQTQNVEFCLKEAEAEYEAKLDKVVSEIRQTIENVHSTKLKDDPSYANAAMQQKEQLAKYFGTEWDKMSQHSKDALVVSTLLAKEGLGDYSWLVIEIAAALEAELKERFFIGYQKYLSNCGINVQDWPEKLKHYDYEDGCFKENDRFALGAFLDMVDPKAKNYRFYSYAFDPTDEKNGKYAMQNYLPFVWANGKAPNAAELSMFYKRISKELTNFRNKAAHGEQTSMENAFSCFYLVLGQNYTANRSGRKEINSVSGRGLLSCLLGWTKSVIEFPAPQKSAPPKNKGNKNRQYEI